MPPGPNLFLTPTLNLDELLKLQQFVDYSTHQVDYKETHHHPPIFLGIEIAHAHAKLKFICFRLDCQEEDQPFTTRDASSGSRFYGRGPPPLVKGSWLPMTTLSPEDAGPPLVSMSSDGHHADQ
ncbi:hypothetical protein Q3G72_013251 [Acer saccharum]|nr:hypothetical protein Q3G72_013251 [Acer saccharum]